MKKIILVLIALILIVVYALANRQQNITRTIKQIEEKKDTFTSIKDAISKQLVIKCEYSDSPDGQIVTTYIKGQTVRLQGTGKQKNVDALLKDNKFYLWDETTKEGMVLEMTNTSNNGGMMMGEKSVNNTDDVISVLEDKKNNCVVSPESADLLELPSDVKFQNTLDFLKK